MNAVELVPPIVSALGASVWAVLTFKHNKLADKNWGRHGPHAVQAIILIASVTTAINNARKDDVHKTETKAVEDRAEKKHREDMATCNAFRADVSRGFETLITGLHNDELAKADKVVASVPARAPVAAPAKEETEGAGAERYRSECEADDAEPHGKACHNLAKIELASHNAAAAASHFEKACTQGFGWSCLNLGTAYALAQMGLERDVKKADALYHRACELGRPEACRSEQWSTNYLKDVGLQRANPG